jgi:hypothetical protein
MVIVAYNHKGVLSGHIIDLSETVTAEVYLKSLKTALRDAIYKKWPDLYQAGPLLLHDNPRPHKAKTVLKVLEIFLWQSLPHTPYSSVRDNDLIAQIKYPLEGEKFISVKEVRIERGQCCSGHQ